MTPVQCLEYYLSTITDLGTKSVSQVGISDAAAAAAGNATSSALANAQRVDMQILQVLKLSDVLLKMMNFALKMMDFALNMMQVLKLARLVSFI